MKNVYYNINKVVYNKILSFSHCLFISMRKAMHRKPEHQLKWIMHLNAIVY